MPTSSQYHPGIGARRSGQGTAEPSPGAGREPAELGEGKQGHAPAVAPRARTRRPAAAGTFPLPAAFLPRWTRAQPWDGEVGAAPDPQPALPRAGAVNLSILTWKGYPRPSKNCLICAEPPRPGAEHAAPACIARAPSRERGQQGGGGGPRKVSGTGPAAREPSAGSCAPARPGSAPGRAAYQQNETRGDRRADTPGSPRTYVPGRATSSPHRSPAAAPPPSQSPRGAAAQARPRPPAPSPGPGALLSAVINKEGRQAHPFQKLSCCMRPSASPQCTL